MRRKLFALCFWLDNLLTRCYSENVEILCYILYQFGLNAISMQLWRKRLSILNKQVKLWDRRRIKNRGRSQELVIRHAQEKYVCSTIRA